jgi:hypothetical protein
MKKNLSSLERVFRLFLGITALGVVYSQPSFGLSETVVAVLGVFLVLNALAARCYLWRWLGINTASRTQCDLNQRPD